MSWTNGTRVRIVPHTFWPHGENGTVRPFPKTICELVGGTEGCARVVPGELGPERLIWVVFDRAASDGDGDGPSSGAEILEEYLELIDSPGRK